MQVETDNSDVRTSTEDPPATSDVPVNRDTIVDATNEETLPVEETPPTLRSHALALPGNFALRDWFQEKRGRRAGLARLLGLSVATVSGWGRINNPTRPREALYLFAIEQLAGIPLAAWIAPQDMEQLSKVIDDWQDFVFVPRQRRPKIDPRQMHIDELLARQSGNLCSTDEPETPTEEGGAVCDEPLDIDSMMGG